MHGKSSRAKGFTAIEVITATFIIGTIVTGLFSLFILSIRSARETERKTVAMALANERMEIIRNMPYADIGTVGGVPAGDIEPEETVERSGSAFVVKTDIRYIDDPYDGLAEGDPDPPDENEQKVVICHRPGTVHEQTLEVGAPALGAHLGHGDTSGPCDSEGGGGDGQVDLYPADYKQVRIEVSWTGLPNVRPIILLTYVAPYGVEGGDPGGTLDFYVLNAAGAPVVGAQVTIINDEIDPPMNYETGTNVEGRVVLPGLQPASDSYQIFVEYDGYTSKQTYDTTPSFIPDANHSHISIAAQKVTSKTFVIDLLSSLRIITQDEGDGEDPPQPLGNIAYHLRGQKTIGVDGDGNVVYIFDESGETDGGGEFLHEDMEWDTYDFTIEAATGYLIKETSKVLPLALNPGEHVDLTVTLVPHVARSLHVTVVTPAGEPIEGASVRLSKGSSDVTLVTGQPGQVLFTEMPGTGNHSLRVEADGFNTHDQNISIPGNEQVVITLTAS